MTCTDRRRWHKPKATDQLGLFGKAVEGRRDGLPPHNHRPTSIAAAEAIKPRAGTIAERVLDFIKEHEGATIDEIDGGTGIRTATVCARLAELRDAQLIVDSGQERKTRSGRSAIVWKAL